jgi:hypothetical protein
MAGRLQKAKRAAKNYEAAAHAVNAAKASTNARQGGSGVTI